MSSFTAHKLSRDPIDFQVTLKRRNLNQKWPHKLENMLLISLKETVVILILDDYCPFKGD